MQPLLKARVQGIKINVFDRQSVGSTIRAVLSAATLGLANAPPVGSPVATAGKAVALDKGFQQINGMAVFTLPIAAQPPGDAAQQVAGQRGHSYPGQDQETRMVGDPMQAWATRSGVPADILIPVGTLPSRRAKEHASQGPSWVVAHQILEVFPHRTSVTQIMMPVQQIFKAGTLAGACQRADFTDLQREQRPQVCQQRRLRDQPLGCQHPLVTHAIGGNLSARRQSDPTALLQFEQQRPGGHVFELAHGVMPVPERGQMLAQAAATPVRMRGQPLANLFQISHGNVPPLNDARFIHEPQIGRGRGQSPAQSEIILAPEPNSHRPRKSTPRGP